VSRVPGPERSLRRRRSVGRRRHDLFGPKLSRKRPEPTASTTSPKQKETTMQRPTIVASSMARAVPSFYNNKKERNNDQSQDRNT
jgi:hypothetical protein